jgi:hypothetical protein
VPCGRWHLAPGLLLHVWEYRWIPVVFSQYANGLVLGELCKKAWFFPANVGGSCRFSLKPMRCWDALSKTATIAAMEDCNPFDLFASPHRSCEINRGLTNGIRSFPAPLFLCVLTHSICYGYTMVYSIPGQTLVFSCRSKSKSCLFGCRFNQTPKVTWHKQTVFLYIYIFKSIYIYAHLFLFSWAVWDLILATVISIPRIVFGPNFANL